MKVGFRLHLFEVKDNGKKKPGGKSIKFDSTQAHTLEQAGVALGKHFKLLCGFFGITIPSDYQGPG